MSDKGYSLAQLWSVKWAVSALQGATPRTDILWWLRRHEGEAHRYGIVEPMEEEVLITILAELDEPPLFPP